MPQAGDRIGRFALTRVLATGQRSEVFLAEADGPPVALKLYRAELADRRAFVTQLQTRFEALKAVSHPGVAKWYEVDRDPELYLAMELVDGVALAEILEAGEKLDSAIASYVGVEVVSGLELLASRNVTHGRLDPSTVLITKEGRVKIVGFDGEPSDGDPDYLAPELSQGATPDSKSDVFSAGRVLRALLVISKERPKEVGELIAKCEAAPASRPTLAAMRMTFGVVERPKCAQALGAIVTRIMSQKAVPEPVAVKKSQWGEDAGGDKTAVDAVDSAALAASIRNPSLSKKSKWEDGKDTSVGVVDSAALAESLRPGARPAKPATPAPQVVAAKPVTPPPQVVQGTKPITPPPQVVAGTPAKPAPRGASAAGAAVPAPRGASGAGSAPRGASVRAATPVPDAPTAPPKGPPTPAPTSAPPKVSLTQVPNNSASTPPKKVPEAAPPPPPPPQKQAGGPVWIKIVGALAAGGIIGTIIYRALIS